MQPTHVLTLNPALPIDVMDRILTATEESLTLAGATRVWAHRSPSGTVVLADLPAVAGFQVAEVYSAMACATA